MSTPTAFVFTDFDDTLAKGDSILPYLLYCIRRGLAPRRQLLKAAVAFLRWKLQPSTGRAAKETSLSFIAGRTVAEMDEIARDFFREEQSKRFFREGVSEMRRLREHGVRVVVVSASSDVYMRVLPEFLPCDEVICTVCEAADGVYTGKAENLHGEMEVAFTVEGGKLTKIEVLSGDMFITAEQLTEYITAIVDAQSIGVDVIAGATVDCQAIGTGINEAFAK